MSAVSNPVQPAVTNASVEIGTHSQLPGMSNMPEWMTTPAAVPAAARQFPQLTGDGGQYDVVVVGGGMVGVCSAWYLKQAGKRVALVEARRIGTGTSGSNTGKLSAQQNVIYSQLTKMHGHDTAKL